MSLLQASNLYKEFNGETLFRNINFSINEKDKIGIIGINGAGKSTLIKMLLGLEETDVDPKTRVEGTISKKSGLKIGYLSQHSDLNQGNSIIEELMAIYDLKNEYIAIQMISKIPSPTTTDMENLAHATSIFEDKDGYILEYKMSQVLEGLDLDEKLWHNKIKDLSGGQQSRVSLAKILLEEPELLILDEPTNHLDLNSIEWLESFLKGYKNAFILISHDTYFLDNTVEITFEMEAKTLKSYKGNYTDYTIQKEIFLSGALKAFNKEQEKMEKLAEFVRKYKAGQKSKQAMGRQKLLERMEKSDNPIIPIRKMKLKFEINEPSANMVLKIENLAKSYGNNTIFKNLNMEMYKGNRIGLIGKNGVGKSTILKIINNLETADSGTVELGQKLEIGYYDQNHKNLNLKNNILEEITTNFDIIEEKARGIAGSFLFTQDDIFKGIHSLSGGERARVSLMKLILSKPNFLIMDEPTNHLDIYSREILEEAIDGYKGTILLVSHDRHFLEAVVDKVYIIDHDGATLFDGNYDAYVAKRSKSKEVAPKAKKQNENNLSYEEQKKLRNKISSLERKSKEIIEKIKVMQAKEDSLYEQAGKETDEAKIKDIQSQIDSAYFETLEIKAEQDRINGELSALKVAN